MTASHRTYLLEALALAREAQASGSSPVGAVLVDLMSVLPLTSALDPSAGVPRWGAAHKQWMRDRRPHAFGVFGMGQEIPSATSAVSLADVRDRWGRPGARL